MNREFRLKSKEGHVLDISVNGIDNINKAPCLILVHGFKGFKDWGFFPFTSERLTKCGYFVVSFNFSHNGVNNKDSDLFDVITFAKNTVSLEVSELVQIIRAYKTGFFGNDIYGKIGLIGHSRGGGVAILSSMIESADAYVVWASVAKFDRYTERQITEWRKQRIIEVVNSRTKQVLQMNVEVLEDIEKNKNNSLSVQKAVKNLNKPLLIIHGTEDLTVPVVEGEQIYNWSNKSITEFEKIPACGHTFDIVHPFAGSNKKFDVVLNKTEDFFYKIFK
ncbi:MAG: alpha/beta hydrolase [Ignavibacteriaceae bacterium]|jgi:pimeloyl-ACP methyl ester carboxylesterase|nr:alpha/beta hydrolase [Ignavibacteriaceae bacterium]